MFFKSRLLQIRQNASIGGKGLMLLRLYTSMFNPFPHATNLQQMTLKTSLQNYEKSLLNGYIITEELKTFWQDGILLIMFSKVISSPSLKVLYFFQIIQLIGSQ